MSFFLDKGTGQKTSYVILIILISLTFLKIMTLHPYKASLISNPDKARTNMGIETSACGSRFVWNILHNRWRGSLFSF